MTRNVEHDDHRGLRELLLGRRVVQVDRDRVRLDDGRELELYGNHGCGGCTNGNYELTLLNSFPINAILDVEVVREDREAPGTYVLGYPETTYRLFVLAQDERIELARFEGTDGNGYYGTGFYLVVHER